MKKKLYAILIFLVAVFLGAGTQSNLYGKISGFFTFFIIAGSFVFMSFAVGLWKSEDNNKNNQQSL